MGQQYLSTDPNAGQEQKYLSTDPNAGQSAGGGLASLITGEKPKGLKGLRDNASGEEILAAFESEPGPLGQLAQGASSGALAPGTMTRIAAEPARRVIHGIAKAIMTKALGSQSPVNKRFPGVDLAEAALEHGTHAKTVEKAGSAAAQEVRAAGQASTAAPVTAREIYPGLQDVGRRGVAEAQGGLPETMRSVQEAARRIGTIPKEGLSMSKALTAKSAWQDLGEAAKRALPGELKGPNAEVAGAVGDRFREVIRGRGDMRVNKALDESQKLMALQQAVQAMVQRPSLLQLVAGAGLGGTTGAMTGDWGKAAMAFATPLAFSPRGLSMMAQGVKASESATAPALEGIYRALLGAADNSGATSTR